MKQFKKLNKLFTKILEPALLKNKINLNKEDFFLYIIETNPKPTMTRFVESYVPCVENVLHWLHIKHFIDKNNQQMVECICYALESFLSAYYTNSIEIQEQFQVSNLKTTQSWFKSILNKN